MKVYKKKSNGRYEEIGTDFFGFPSDGIWLVWNGRDNCVTKLEDIKGKTIANLQGMAETYKVIEDTLISMMKDGTFQASNIAKEVVNNLYLNTGESNGQN
tara:strand:- start:95 stop:394 length:300 start_codon:yes stop_codon:yes gene_type:complete